jgi:hypothetical protein
MSKLLTSIKVWSSEKSAGYLICSKRNNPITKNNFFLSKTAQQVSSLLIDIAISVYCPERTSLENPPLPLLFTACTASCAQTVAGNTYYVTLNISYFSNVANTFNIHDEDSSP